jgi:hypothetical protein
MSGNRPCEASHKGMTGCDSRSWVMLRSEKTSSTEPQAKEPVDEKNKICWPGFPCRSYAVRYNAEHPHLSILLGNRHRNRLYSAPFLRALVDHRRQVYSVEGSRRRYVINWSRYGQLGHRDRLMKSVLRLNSRPCENQVTGVRVRTYSPGGGS